MERREFLGGLAALFLVQAPLHASTTNGKRLAQAALAQVGVTTGYDPGYTRIGYPGGDVPRSTGVCADVVIRAARDGLGIDLQKLVHEDMERAFDAYPARRVWGSRGPDTNIDHRRVLNLETCFKRVGACVWSAERPTPGDGFPMRMEQGDLLTWLLDARLPHIGMVVSAGGPVIVVHNIGRGAEQIALAEFHGERAVGHYRWPVA